MFSTPPCASTGVVGAKLIYKNDVKTLEALLDVYDVLQDQTGVINTFSRFAVLAVQTRNFGLLINRLHVYLMMHDIILKAELCGYTFFAFLLHDVTNPQIKIYLLQALEFYIESDNHSLLTKFMAKLKVSSEYFYEVAQNILIEK